MTYYLRGFIIMFLLTGCMNTQPVKVKCKNEPWILNPNISGKVGAVGSAMRTYDQKTSSQRKLAITRALDELSLQRGVRVNLSMYKKETLSNQNVQNSMDTRSSYQTNTKMTAHIQDVCKDNSSAELFIWMVMD